MTTLRNIDIAGQAVVSLIDQPAPMLEWLPIDRLVVDDAYQRGLAAGNWASIRRIASDFRWSRFTPVLVAPIEGGLFAIIDGQHRTHAAALCGIERVPTMAVHMTKAEQATAFAWINSQMIRITPHHIYKAALAAGEEWALRCELAVSQADCKLMTSNASTANKKAGEIYCIGLIRDFVVRNQAQAVTAALKALRQYDDAGRVALYSDYVLRPLIEVIAEEPAFQRLDIAAVFRKFDPFRVLDTAERMRADGTTKRIAHRNALRLLFNQHSSKGAA